MADTDSSCAKGMSLDGNAAENLQEEATCSICLDYFKDPVMTKCGHNFCRNCISLCWRNLDSSFTCPQCRKRSHKPLLTPNRQLASMVKIAQELGPSVCSLQQETQCEKHGEKLKLFCEDDQKAICVVCDRAKEHRAHVVVPIVEAVIECKEKLYGYIVPLKRKLEDVLILTTEEEKKPAELKTKVEAERKIIVSKFEELHRLLNEEKRTVLSNLEDRRTELHNKIQSNIIKLTEQSSSLQQLIKEAEGKLPRTNTDVLKDMKSLLLRCEHARFQIPPTVSSELQRGVNNIHVQYAALTNILNKLTVYLDCGHNFCRTCITQHLDRLDPYFSCPVCAKVFQDRNLTDSWPLLKQLTERLKKVDIKALAEPEESQCKTHKLPLLLYCAVDQEAVCLVCRESRRHKSHAVFPIEEAAQECKEHLQTSLDPLKHELADIENCKSSDELKAALLQENLKRLKETVLSEFEALHQVMNTEEKMLLARLKQEGDKILKNIDANVKKYEAQISSISTLVMKITETCEKTPAEMLKDGQAYLNRCEYKMQERPMCGSALLDKKFLAFLGHYVGPNLLLKKYKEIVTLNARTAQPYLILSADGKTVKYSFVKQNLPDYPERFDFEPCVQGCEGFTSGRHYWEVEVGVGKHWAVGITAESAKKKGRNRFTPKMGIWSVEYVYDYYDALTFPKPTRLSLKERPQKVGLYLDYEQQQLSFYNAENMAHIYTFTDSFKEKVFPVFGTYDPVTPLRMCC
ncbi:E3 ubiquitin-protein ligase TRIM39 [Microcaecilia unicolor]|uniref:E3 ubiquitin-protein ligase TRIM39-like n=1 Tax=Microcaecilia unicolor TaxID=1415580 RepID=A0A6P7YNK6_9AMPH|nr:E3 ubiquitin-protein ligase TRIM39-like [Microcaecilia unicolor]